MDHPVENIRLFKRFIILDVESHPTKFQRSHRGFEMYRVGASGDVGNLNEVLLVSNIDAGGNGPVSHRRMGR